LSTVVVVVGVVSVVVGVVSVVVGVVSVVVGVVSVVVGDVSVVVGAVSVVVGEVSVVESVDVDLLGSSSQMKPLPPSATPLAIQPAAARVMSRRQKAAVRFIYAPVMK
jgi:hypothetical protein